MPDDELGADAAKFAEHIAARVLEGLEANVISASFPHDIGEAIKEARQSGPYTNRFGVPLLGTFMLFIEMRTNPDGTIDMELQRWDGSRFWRGTFRPVAG